MASLTTGHLLFALRQVCQRSPIVSHVDVLAIDPDTLHVRVYLVHSGTFVNVFYNIATNKTSFALVERDQRIYGVDNAKMSWHQHPFADPAQHVACGPMEFGEFLCQIEAYYAVQP